MKRLGAVQDFGGGQLINWRFEQLAAAPASPLNGRPYYNTGSNVPMYWNGTAWRPMDAAALTDGSIPNAALATNPLSRGNHTGTQPASTIVDLATVVQAYRLNQFAAPNGNLDFAGFGAINVADPTTPQGIATKSYTDNAVQSAAAGIDSKPSVRVVAVGNITLSATQTIDGVSLAAGDRVLLTAQSTASQNGVYLVASGAWPRATDADTTGEITPGAFWFVEEGTTYGKTQWRCNNTGAITIGTTAIAIVQFGAANTYTAAASGGLQLQGNAFSVLLPSASGLQTTATGLTVVLDSSSGLQLTSAGLAVQVQAGGGLQRTAGGLALAAGVARGASGTITGDGSTLTFTATHNLNTKNIIPAFQDSSGNGVEPDWQASTVNAMAITFGTPPANGVVYSWALVGF